MNHSYESEVTTIDARIKEAEAYRTHGLLNESLELYEAILSLAADLDPGRQEIIQEKVSDLRKEILRLDQMEEKITPDEIDRFQKTWTAEENLTDIFGSISAYKELGLFKEAIEEYMKLFRLDYPVANIIPGLTACLLGIHSPSGSSTKSKRLSGIII